jgi:hypothetical protein
MAQCCGIDHHSGEYTEQQRADLDLVLAFNRSMASAIEDSRDVSGVEALLDPDPLRYMWVDEGEGRLGGFLDLATKALAAAPALEGHHRVRGETVWSSGAAARPAVAAGAGGQKLYAWVEWRKDEGDQVLALLHGPDLPGGEPVVLSGEPADCFRPTALFDRADRAWVLWSRSDSGAVTVWCRRFFGGEWSPEEQVARSEHPSFNQECVAHPDGSIEVVWQAPTGQRFGIASRRWREGVWEEPRWVSEGSEANVWDPAVAALPGGGSAYAWCEYFAGSYRVVERESDGRGTLGPPRALTGGSDYALHPSLAVTPAGEVWCAFDILTVAGHGGSGPTRLRPTAELNEQTLLPGMREGGAAIPGELMPEVSASLRVVRLDEDGLYEAHGELAAALDIVPGGLPRLVSDESGSLTVAYRVHRRLPLMTYYWEVAAQTLGPDGWGPPRTFAASDGTLEEPALAALPEGALLAWQSDGRLERALTWTEGFGGRECPVLLEHHGEVVWHGMHGTGSIRSAVLGGGGRAAAVRRTGDLVVSDERREVRAWAGAERPRYSTEVAGTDYTLYWGDLHRHSLISRCTSGDEPSLADFYRYSWDVCEYDFWAVTDHSENSSDYQWWSIKKVADLFRVEGRFVPFYGFEWTALMGHQNVIYGDVARDAPIFSAYARGSDTPDQLWAQLDKFKQHLAITIPHHPGSAIVPYDWDYADERYLRVVEVFQACRGNYEFDGCFRQYADGTMPGTFVLDGLRRGQRFGLIASSDHGHGASYVGAYATSLDRASVFDALQDRRVFAATQRDVVVDVRIGEVFMGSEIVLDGPVELSVHARGYRELARIDVVRNGVVVHSELPSLNLPAGWLTVPLRLEWGRNDVTTDCSGRLSVTGGEVVQTPFWSTDITAVSPISVSWTSTTKSLGPVYGSQRGGIEVTLVGPRDAGVEVAVGHGGLRVPLGELVSSVVSVPLDGPGRMTIQPGTGGLSGLGTRERSLRFVDDAGGPAFYYVRVFQTDGEMAWSSPIWVDRPPSGGRIDEASVESRRTAKYAGS